MNSLFKGLLASVTIASLAFPFTTPAQDFFGPAKSGDLLSLREALSAEEEIDPASLVRPIYFAAQRGHADVVALLLEHGAPANAKLNFGTALQIAARGDHTDVVTLLLGAGADPNLPGGEESKTPLDEAAERGALNAAEVLLMHGADVNARTRRDHPPIHLAARRERTEMVTFLQNHGAQPRHVNQIDLKDLVGVDVKAGRMAAAECLGCRAVVRGERRQGVMSLRTLMEFWDVRRRVWRSFHIRMLSRNWRGSGHRTTSTSSSPIRLVRLRAQTWATQAFKIWRSDSRSSPFWQAFRLIE